MNYIIEVNLPAMMFISHLCIIVSSGPLVCESNPKNNCWNGTEVLENEKEKTFTTDNILEQSELLTLIRKISFMLMYNFHR